eukprot:Selendium_serpulae@DN8967_c0_g1_i1.p1
MIPNNGPYQGQHDPASDIHDRLVGPLRGFNAEPFSAGPPAAHRDTGQSNPDTMLSPLVRQSTGIGRGAMPTSPDSDSVPASPSSPRERPSWPAAQRPPTLLPGDKTGRLSHDARAQRPEDVEPDPSYGPRLARAFDDLKNENRWMKNKYEAAVRQSARYEAASNKNIPLKGGYRESPTICQCSEVLKNVLDVVESRFESYERVNWQRRIELAEAERDELSIRASIAAERLAQLEARILSDPFHASLLSESSVVATPLAQLMQQQTQMSNSQSAHPRQNQELMRGLKDAYRRIALAEEVNDQLERRLMFEKSMARAWQPDLKAMQGQLRDYLSQLDNMVKLQRSSRRRGGRSTSREDSNDRSQRSSSGGPSSQPPGCSVMATARLMEMRGFDTPNLSGGETVSRTERESLRLLRLAKERIEADDRRLTVFSHRVKELEHEVADLRVRLLDEAANTRNGTPA